MPATCNDSSGTLSSATTEVTKVSVLSSNEAGQLEEEGQKSCSAFLRTSKKNFLATRGLLPALAFSFTLTFTVFPAVIQDTSYKFMADWKEEDSYFILMTLTLFNVWDTVGRYAASVSCM